MSPCVCVQAGAGEMEGFTKEVLMMWKVSVVEGERCTVPRAGKKGLKKKRKYCYSSLLYDLMRACVLPQGR